MLLLTSLRKTPKHKMSMNLIKSIRKDLSLIFIGALITICIIDFLLIDIPEIFIGGYKFGQIIYKLCMSYISAFIFYFLVVHIKQQKDKKNLYPYVTKKVNRVIGSAWVIIAEIAKASNITLAEKYPTKEELDIICKKINPHAKAPLLLGSKENNVNWIQYFDFHKKRSNDAIEKAFKNMPFLESELVNILTRIEDNSLFMYLVHLVNIMPIKNQDITFIQSNLSDYIELIKKLEKYAVKKLAKSK